MKKRNGRTLALLLCLILAAACLSGALAGCKGSGRETTAEEESEEPTTRRRRGSLTSEAEETTKSAAPQTEKDTTAESGSAETEEETTEALTKEPTETETADTTEEPQTPAPAESSGGPETETSPGESSGTPAEEAGSIGEPMDIAFTGDWDDFLLDVLIAEAGLVAEDQRGQVSEYGSLFGSPRTGNVTWFNGTGLYAWEKADLDGDGEEDLIAVVGGPAQTKLSNNLPPDGGGYELNVVLLRHRNGEVFGSPVALRVGFDSVAPADIVIHLVNAGGTPQILVFQDNIWMDGWSETDVRRAFLWLLEAAPDTGLHTVYGLAAEMKGNTNDVPLAETNEVTDMCDGRGGSYTQIETKLRPGDLDIRAGVPLSVFYNMMNPYLEKRRIAVDESFSPLTDADGEDILSFHTATDGTDAWIELDR